MGKDRSPAALSQTLTVIKTSRLSTPDERLDELADPRRQGRAGGNRTIALRYAHVKISPPPKPTLDQNVLEVVGADVRLEDSQKHDLVGTAAAVGVYIEAIPAGYGLYGH